MEADHKKEEEEHRARHTGRGVKRSRVNVIKSMLPPVVCRQ